MNKNPTTYARRFSRIARLLCIAFSCLLTMAVSPAHAQTSDQQKLMAVMNVINTYLLDGREPPIERPGGEGVLLTLNEESPSSYQVTQNLFAEFELQEESIELCFLIESADTILAGDLTIEVNGEPQSAHLGENCVNLNRNQQRDVNYINLIVNTAGKSVTLTTLELQSTNQSQLTLPRLTRGEWDERAVRKVIKIFAFGGHASDDQIYLWSLMKPADAIVEMLTFEEHNLKLSPLAQDEQYIESATQNGKLWDWQNFMSNIASNLPIPTDRRDQYGLDGYNFDDAYNRMITVRGINPFRQRIGFWETNYHLAVNRDAGVSRRQVAAYYDLIMGAHEDGLPYQEVMGIAAKSAAIADQYGHDRNQWRFDNQLGEFACACNDDFAREIHQLFYGIFGADDPDHHESVTIPNTARLLTDMPINSESSNFEDVRVNFGTDRHYSGVNGEPPLSVLKQTIPHSSSADQKIDFLMPLSMQHAESLHNLPIMVIGGLADNSLTDSKRTQLRASWASMGVNRVLLDFIHAYAISSLFHSPTQVRFFTTHERALFMANKNNLENLEAYFGGGSYGGRAGRSVGGVISEDNAGDFFRPIHNVFGGQSNQEAADSALAFENNYNRLTDREYEMRDSVGCDTCNLGAAWEKQWQNVLPKRSDGNFYVADIAEWLWVHVTGSLDNYTELERAQLYSVLGAVRRAPGESYDQNHAIDFTLLMCIVNDYQRENANPNLSLNNILTTVMHQHCTFYKSGPDGYDQDEIDDINSFYTGQQIADNPVAQQLLLELGNETIPLESTGLSNSDDLREHARERINNALAFIFNTPFVFAEGR